MTRGPRAFNSELISLESACLKAGATRKNGGSRRAGTGADRLHKSNKAEMARGPGSSKASVYSGTSMYVE
jgi:hypothetical protein